MAGLEKRADFRSCSMRPRDEDVLGSGVLGPQSETQRGVNEAESAEVDGKARGSIVSSSEQTPPASSCEESVVTAEAGPSPSAKPEVFNGSRRMSEKNAGRTTDIGE